MASRSVPMTAAIISDRRSIGRWRSAQCQHLTIAPWRVWKRNLAPRSRPHASQLRSTIVAALTRSILFAARQTWYTEIHDRTALRPGGAELYAAVDGRRRRDAGRLQEQVGRGARLLLLRLRQHLNARAGRPGPGRRRDRPEGRGPARHQR